MCTLSDRPLLDPKNVLVHFVTGLHTVNSMFAILKKSILNWTVKWIYCTEAPQPKTAGSLGGQFLWKFT